MNESFQPFTLSTGIRFHARPIDEIVRVYFLQVRWYQRLWWERLMFWRKFPLVPLSLGELVLLRHHQATDSMYRQLATPLFLSATYLDDPPFVETSH